MNGQHDPSNQPLSGDQLLAILEALANPHRLRILAVLSHGRVHVSQLARELNMSRPLLYMHLKRLDAAGLLSSDLELSEDGKAMKFYAVKPFSVSLTPEVIAEAAKSLTIPEKGAGDSSRKENE